MLKLLRQPDRVQAKRRVGALIAELMHPGVRRGRLIVGPTHADSIEQIQIPGRAVKTEEGAEKAADVATGIPEPVQAWI